MQKIKISDNSRAYELLSNYGAIPIREDVVFVFERYPVVQV